MSTPIESSNVSMGTTVGQSHSSPAVDRPISAIANFMKPVVSSATNSQVLVVRKNSAISSLVQSPTVSGSQLLTAGADAPKIVNVPIASLQNSGKIANVDGTTQFAIAKNAGVKVVWPQNMASGLLPVKQITPHNNSQNAQPIAVKRTVAPSLGNQVITKVIITNNNSNQAGTPVSVSANVSGTGSSLNTPQSLLLSSPSKTITLSRNIMNFAGTQQIVKTTTPTKQGVYLLSPVKPLSKITTVPSSLMKSPRRIAPATSTFSSMATSKLSTITGSVATSTPAITKTITVPQSPKKILLKTVAGNLSSVLASTPVTPSHVPSSGMGTQQLQGNNVHFVRLVSAPNSSTTNTTVANKQASFLPSTTTTTVVSSLPTITVTSQMCKTAALAKQAVKIKPAQKILIPAPISSSQGATSSSLTGTQMGQLPSGTLIPIVGSGQGYVVVPANYMTQAQQASRSVQNAPVLIQNILPAPTMSTSSSTISDVSQSGAATSANTSGNFLLTSATNQTISHHVSKYMNGRVPVETADSSRPRKPCNCTKSQCLKLYCDCFASGEFCNGCNCNNCYNNLTHEEERQKAIKSCLDRNRMAFHPKIGKSREGDTERRHTKGCHCKRSGCLKNYCECYEAKILCTDLCKCIGCKNFEDSYERKTLMHLADAVEVRVQQQAAAITNFTSDIFDGLPRPQLNLQRGNALPISFVNDEVIEATVACLLARAHQAEKQRKSEAETEKVLLEEFGLCLMSIISRSSQVEDMCSDVDSNS